MRISDWSSDVCSSDLPLWRLATGGCQRVRRAISTGFGSRQAPMMLFARARASGLASAVQIPHKQFPPLRSRRHAVATLGLNPQEKEAVEAFRRDVVEPSMRSEEHESELQSLMRISYAVVCLQKKITKH